MTGRARGWTITLNNYNEEEWNMINENAQLHSEKFIFGKEVGKSGTPHIQGYVYFKNPKDMKSVKKVLDNQRLHLEVAKGNTKQNMDYCSKDGDYVSSNMEIEKPKKSEYDLDCEFKEWLEDRLRRVELEWKEANEYNGWRDGDLRELRAIQLKEKVRKIENGFYDYDEIDLC